MIVHHETKRKIHNQHEWDPLEEVVVGRWVPGTFQAPPLMDDDKMMKQQFPYIPEAAWPYLKQFQGTTLPPQDDERYHQEQEYLVQQLQARGIRVLRPDPTTFPIVATTQCYARDPIVVIGDKLIVTNLQFEGRRQETANYTRLALELAKHYQGEVIMMPPNQVGYTHADNAYLEGGDVFVDGTHIYVGMTGNATNDKGLEWLRTTLGDYYTVHKIALHQHVLHLDCALMLINDHQGIICKDDFVDFEALPDRFKNRQWVEVEPAQAQLMATNGIVLDPSTVMLINHFPDVIEKVRAMGIEVIEIPFDKSNYFGGGLRCSYQPITRS